MDNDEAEAVDRDGWKCISASQTSKDFMGKFIVKHKGGGELESMEVFNCWLPKFSGY